MLDFFRRCIRHPAVRQCVDRQERPPQALGTRKRARQVQRVLLHGLRRFGQAAVWIGPKADEEDPMLDEHRQEFGIHLTQDAPGFGAARCVYTAMTLPQSASGVSAGVRPQSASKVGAAASVSQAPLVLGGQRRLAPRAREEFAPAAGVAHGGELRGRSGRGLGRAQWTAYPAKNTPRALRAGAEPVRSHPEHTPGTRAARPPPGGQACATTMTNRSRKPV